MGWWPAGTRLTGGTPSGRGLVRSSSRCREPSGTGMVRLGSADLQWGSSPMIRKPETVAFWRGRLPHWKVVDGRYFVTIHVAGAIPKQGQERIHALAAEADK